MKNSTNRIKISCNIKHHLSRLKQSKMKFMERVAECGTDCNADCFMEENKHSDCDLDCRDCVSECSDDSKEIIFTSYDFSYKENNNVWFRNRAISSEGTLNLDDKDDDFIAFSLSLAEQREDYETALRCINHLLRKSDYQQSSILVIKQASLYYKLQDFCSALLFLDKVLSKNNNNIIALMIRAKVYTGMQNYTSALIDLEKILSIESNAQFATALYNDIKARMDYILN